MNPTTMFGAIGGALAKTAANAVAEGYKKKTNTNNTATTNTQTQTPTYNYSTTPAKSTNEHADYINKTYAGGLDAYTKLQQDRYNQALQNSSNPSNLDLLKKIQTDSQKVGYSLTNPNVVPQFDEQSYMDKLNAAYRKIEGYESQLSQIPMPDYSEFERNTNGYQDDMAALLSALENYQGADSMSMDESMARAYSQLNGIYNANLDKTLENYNKNAISRGMFGQLPVEAMKANAISETELNKSKATNDLASNLYGQDYNMARQKDADFYNKINKQSGLLTNLYNTEADQYQNAVNEYLNAINLANMKDQGYKDDIYSQLDMINTKYNATQSERQNTIDTLGAYSNDYQAKINQLTNDNDTSNDWQIPYLNSLRNDKISGQAQAESKNQSEMVNLALDVFKQTGVASDWIADALGIKPGTYTADYADKLADNYRANSKSSSSKSKDESTYDMSKLISEARLLANSLYPDGYSTSQYNEVVDLLKQMYTGEISDSELASMLSDGTSGTGGNKLYSNPVLDYIRNEYK